MPDYFQDRSNQTLFTAHYNTRCKKVKKFKFSLTYHLGFHGDGHAGHGEQGEDGLVEALILKEVSREVNGEEVALGAHVRHVPEGDVGFAYHELSPAEHVAVHTWRSRKDLLLLKVMI